MWVVSVSAGCRYKLLVPWLDTMAFRDATAAWAVLLHFDVLDAVTPCGGSRRAVVLT
jgi:hypothetical protein